MILTITDAGSGQELATIDLVKGSTIQSKNIGRDIISGVITFRAFGGA